MNNDNKKVTPPARRAKKNAAKKRTLVVLSVLLLIIGVVAGSTLAWFTDYTDPVTNTFTVGKVHIKLEETSGSEYKMVPGHPVTKNPFVTVLKDSEKCFLFVELKEDLGCWKDLPKPNGTSADKWKFTELLQYSITDTVVWTKLDGVEGVYYLVVEKNKTADSQFKILKNDEVRVSHLVTEKMLEMLDVSSNAKPTLTVSAYAIQYFKTNGTPFEAAEAWALVKPSTP